MKLYEGDPPFFCLLFFILDIAATEFHCWLLFWVVWLIAIIFFCLSLRLIASHERESGFSCQVFSWTIIYCLFSAMRLVWNEYDALHFYVPNHLENLPLQVSCLGRRTMLLLNTSLNISYWMWNLNVP